MYQFLHDVSADDEESLLAFVVILGRLICWWGQAKTVCNWLDFQGPGKVKLVQLLTQIKHKADENMTRKRLVVDLEYLVETLEEAAGSCIDADLIPSHHAETFEWNRVPGAMWTRKEHQDEFSEDPDFPMPMEQDAHDSMEMLVNHGNHQDQDMNEGNHQGGAFGYDMQQSEVMDYQMADARMEQSMRQEPSERNRVQPGHPPHHAPQHTPISSDDLMSQSLLQIFQSSAVHDRQATFASGLIPFSQVETNACRSKVDLDHILKDPQVIVPFLLCNVLTHVPCSWWICL